MSDISSIVDIINSTLTNSTTGVMKDERFQRGKFYGLTELITRGDETIPTLVDNNNKKIEVVINDSYPIQVYHRVLSVPPAEQNNDGFGDDINYTQNYSMKLVCINDRTKTKIDKFALTEAFLVGFPSQIAETTFVSDYVKATKVTVGEPDYVGVYTEEYNIPDTKIPPYIDFFSVNYTVSMEISKDCYSLC